MEEITRTNSRILLIKWRFDAENMNRHSRSCELADLTNAILVVSLSSVHSNVSQGIYIFFAFLKAQSAVFCGVFGKKKTAKK